MGLDAHVLPISAFMVNDYEPAMVGMMKSMGMQNVPAFRFGPAGVETITPSRSLWGRVQLHTGIWALRRRYRRWRASLRRKEGLLFVEWMRASLKASLGVDLDWSEEGGTALTRQLPRSALHALRTYALRLEFPEALGKARAYRNEKGEDVDLVGATYEKADELKLESERFAHLFAASDVHGYYLPAAFDPPQKLKDPAWTEGRFDFLKWIPVGSSVRLLQELEELNESLGIRSRWDVRDMGTGPSETGDEVLGQVHYGWKLLEGFARTSVETRLPICFDG